MNTEGKWYGGLVLLMMGVVIGALAYFILSQTVTAAPTAVVEHAKVVSMQDIGGYYKEAILSNGARCYWFNTNGLSCLGPAQLEEGR